MLIVDFFYGKGIYIHRNCWMTSSAIGFCAGGPKVKSQFQGPI